MISLIVCSKQPSLSEQLLRNLGNTVGMPYEVICVDNSAGRFNIFEAYNYGASQARFDLLCFMHEDILFHTANWGRIVADKLADKEVGVVGIAGAVFKSAAPSPWWISDTQDHTSYLRFNILQHFSTGVRRQQSRGTRGGKAEAGKVEGGQADGGQPDGGQADGGKADLGKPGVAGAGWDEVVVLDGVWLCCRKEVWLDTAFDGERYDGFHFYDLDFSFAVRDKGRRNYVCQEILIEHFSAGNMDMNWIRGAEIFYRKWRKALPASVGNLSAGEIRDLECSAAGNFLRILTYNRHHDLRLWLKYWIRTAAHKPFRRDTYRSFLMYGRTYFK